MLLWWLAEDPRLSARARSPMADRQNIRIVHTATGWEIAPPSIACSSLRHG